MKYYVKPTIRLIVVEPYTLLAGSVDVEKKVYENSTLGDYEEVTVGVTIDNRGSW